MYSDEPGLAQDARPAKYGGCLFGFDQRLVKAAGGRTGEDGGGHRQQGRVGVCAGRDFVEHADLLYVANAAEDHGAFAILGGFHGVGLGNGGGGSLQGAEPFGEQVERLGLIEAAGDDEDRIVGAVVPGVEILQALDGDVLDIGLGSDGGFAVVVPFEGGGHDAFGEYALGRVFAGLILVADDAHLGREDFLADGGAHHAIGFEVDCPLEIFVAGGEDFEVVGAVEAGGGVARGAAVGLLLLASRWRGEPKETRCSMRWAIPVSP